MFIGLAHPVLCWELESIGRVAHRKWVSLFLRRGTVPLCSVSLHQGPFYSALPEDLEGSKGAGCPPHVPSQLERVQAWMTGVTMHIEKATKWQRILDNRQR